MLFSFISAYRMFYINKFIKVNIAVAYNFLVRDYGLLIQNTYHILKVKGVGQ
jgi:hypothetical protein